MFNLFETDTKDIQFLLDNAGKDVLINDVSKRAIITNPSINELEDRYIHTLDNVSRGDLVVLEGKKYLVITESITKRYGKFKALMRHCNYAIEVPGEEVCVVVGENEFGLPIYECTTGDPSYVSGIVDNKSFTIDLDNAINFPENQISVIVQDNETNNEKFDLNFTFNAMNTNWKVLNRDLTKNGLLILTCQSA